MDLKLLSEEELQDLRRRIDEEIDRRVSLKVLPAQVENLAKQWAELFPDDPLGWRNVSIKE